MPEHGTNPRRFSNLSRALPQTAMPPTPARPDRKLSYLKPSAQDRRILQLAWPIMLANIGEPLKGTVDTVLVGYLPNPILIGAVAVGALIFSFLFWCFGFLRLGTGGFTAQARGRDDKVEIKAVLFRALLLAMLLALPLLLLQAPLAWLAFDLMDASQEVTAAAGIYYDIRIWSAPAILSFYCMHGWLLGMQDTRSVMVLTLTVHCLNAGLSSLFVLAFDWGMAGVAAGTVAADYLALLVGAALLYRHLRGNRAAVSLSRLLDKHRLLALFKANRDLFLRTLALMTALGLFTRVGAQLGDAVLSANQLLQQLILLMAYALDAFADASEAQVGRAVGQGRRREAKQAIVSACRLGLAASLLFGLIYWLFGGAILGLFTRHDQIVALALDYLPYLAVLPVIGVWAYIFDGVFTGATRTAEMRNSMILSLAGYWLLLELLVPPFGNDGLWIAILSWLALRGISLALLLPRVLAAAEPPKP